MSKIKNYLLVGLLTLSSCLTFAATQSAPQNQTTPTSYNRFGGNMIPSAPNINASGYVLMDANSGKILASKAMNTQMQPASLTKLMTLYITAQELASGRIHLNDMVRISDTAWKQTGSKMFLRSGDKVSVRDLISGVIVASGNDSCDALAEYIAGDETSFAQLMNQAAKQLGMNHSHFIDSTGLPKPGHVTTPHDLALLTRAIIKQYPQYYSWYKQKWITYDNIRQPNRNRLLWRDTSVDGLKTGHTKEAGYCLVSSANRKGMRLISVVMGTPSDSDRSAFSETLLNWGYRFFKTYKLFSANKPVAQPRVWYGNNKHVNLGLKQDFYITIPNGSYSKLKATTQLPKELKAPIKEDQNYGNVTITFDGKTIKKLPLVALENDNKAGFWGRLGDHISHTL